MAENSKIQWTDHTFNPWIGCTKVSQACKFCYAESLDNRWRGGENWGPQGKRTKTSESNWRKPLKWNKEAGKKGIRYKVFCASLADVFEDIEELLDWRQELFELIEQTPNLNWLLLTKRPENILDFSPKIIPDNIWFGTTIEDQGECNKRWHYMSEVSLMTNNIVFVSCEPMLGYISFRNHKVGPDWVIIGGESGPMDKIRSLSIHDAEQLIKECDRFGTPVLFKQLGEIQAREYGLKDRKGGDQYEYPITLEKLKRFEFPES